MTALATVRRKRGYLLSYHRLLRDLDPQLLAAYDAFYTRLTLVPRVLTSVEKETVWIALIVATRARVGKLHFERAAAAGMSKAAIADAAAIGAACAAHDTFAFGADAFARWADAARLERAYLRTFDAARGRTRPVLADIAAVVAHAGLRDAAGMRAHLVRAFARRARREQLAEALSFVLLHCGGPTMLAAMAVWLDAARARRVPSPFAPARTGRARIGAARIGAARIGTARNGTARNGTTRNGRARISPT